MNPDEIEEERRFPMFACRSSLLVWAGLAARTALEHIEESVVSARGKLADGDFSVTSRATRATRADSGCLPRLVSVVQSTDTRQCDDFRRG